uniref:Uncharacterized protein n=1 Tax=Timema poppense TaxID=170557 RepID=A0A7R9H5G0_TIMPO|nr:unnamed protein product [Timema poppensis]
MTQALNSTLNENWRVRAAASHFKALFNTLQRRVWAARLLKQLMGTSKITQLSYKNQ